MSGLEAVTEFLDIVLNYITLQLGRCALFSVFILALIMVFRRIYKKNIFLKGLLWSLMPVTLFIGKLKLFYENAFCVYASWWWTDLCMGNIWVSRIYFAGMAVTGIVLYDRRRKLRHFVKGMATERVAGTKVFVCGWSVTPFTAGMLFPKIVMPEAMLREYREEEIKTILLHEKTHIRLGHLWFYLIWDMLHVLLWFNPLFVFCLKYFRADLEDICDRVTIQAGNSTGYEYGSLLLKSMRFLQNEPTLQTIKPPVAFAGEDRYLQIKQRMKTVSEYRRYSRTGAFCMAGIAVFSIAILLSAIRVHSYARYQECHDIYIYNLTGTDCLVEDSEELREAITYDEDYLYVNGEQLSILLTDKNISESYYAVSFYGYNKLPGYGNRGCPVIIKADVLHNGISKVSYQRSKDLLDWIYKNLI